MNRQSAPLPPPPAPYAAQRALENLLRFGYYLLYQPLAWSYDGVAALVSAGHWRDWVLSALDDLPGPRVLELGHGPGHLLVALHSRGVSAVGLDLSKQMSRQAAGRLRRQALPLTLARGRAQNLPFPEATFDQVVSTFPSEYAFDPATLAEVRRVLAPGGRWNILLSAWTLDRGLWGVVARRLLRLDGQLDLPRLENRLTPLRDRFIAQGYQAQVEVRPVGGSQTLWILASPGPVLHPQAHAS